MPGLLLCFERNDEIFILLNELVLILLFLLVVYGDLFKPTKNLLCNGINLHRNNRHFFIILLIYFKLVRDKEKLGPGGIRIQVS